MDVLSEFNTADILIGSHNATDIAFAYGAEWTAAFANVTPPVFDTGVYAQDVFVGGNNSTPVGIGMVLGTVTASTTGMSPGSYDVRIDNSIDGVSTLGLAGQPEALNGTGAFTIILVPIPTVSGWGLAAMMLLLLTAGTLIVRGQSGCAKDPRPGARTMSQESFHRLTARQEPDDHHADEKNTDHDHR